MKSKNLRPRHFASDNYASVHPDIMKALVNCNEGHATAYGDDEYTARAQKKFQKIFGDVEVFFVFNGTAANVLSLRSMIDRYESVICSARAHIQEDECGAPENILGCKLVTLPTENGKITAQQIEKSLLVNGDQHKTQTRAISLSQSTELGTVYSQKELKQISEVAKKHGIFVHMDGARIANAIAHLDRNIKAATHGVDVLSFGGTKNGLMYGEAIVFFNKKLAQKMKFYRKQNMQLASKMRFISAQFEALLTDSLWLKNAEHSNKMAQLFSKELTALSRVEITQSVDANALFVRIPNSLIEKLQKTFHFYLWEKGTEHSIVRWMTAFDTTSQDIEQFVATIKK
ncbi:MAG: low specificity L-threonine aldolase [Bdellovibrionales bacterium]